MKKLFLITIAMLLVGPISSHAQYQVGQRNSALGCQYTTPLDCVSVSAVQAYSTRLLRAAYAGYSMQVTRTSDNTTANIGFVSGNLDTATLLSFCASTNCVRTIAYDQSGNGRNATASVSAGPLIVVSGTLQVTTGGKASPFYTSSSSQCESTLAATWLSSTPLTYNIVAQNATTTTGGGHYFFGTYPNGYSGWYDSSTFIYNENGTGSYYFSLNYAAAIGVPAIYTQIRATSTTGAVYKNGSFIYYNASGFSAYPAVSGAFLIGCGSATTTTYSYYDGYIPEMIVFTPGLSNLDRRNLENNQETYYAIAGS